MTKPRLTRAERMRIAERRRAEAEARHLAMIERRLAGLERLANSALLTQIAYNEGKISRARCEAIAGRLKAELIAMRQAEALQLPPPAMKS